MANKHAGRMTCRTFLDAYRRQVHADDLAAEQAATVSGNSQSYTVHTAAGMIDVTAHCKYCARVSALEELAAKRDAAT